MPLLTTETLNAVIASLNSRANVASLLNGNVDCSLLRELEISFIRKFQPQRYLIAYGTLAPGQTNHSIVASIKGNWAPATINGKIEYRDFGPTLGYPVFSYTPFQEGNDISVFVLESDELTDHWNMLDDFEGEGYRRTLTSFRLEDDTIGYGCIYSADE